MVGSRFALDEGEPSAYAFFLEEGGRRPDDAPQRQLSYNPRTCFLIAMSYELGARSSAIVSGHAKREQRSCLYPYMSRPLEKGPPNRAGWNAPKAHNEQ